MQHAFKIMLYAFILLCALPDSTLNAQSTTTQPWPIRYSEARTIARRHYTTWSFPAEKLSFTTVRPKPTKSTIAMQVPAAFTVVKDRSVDGVYRWNQRVYQADKVNKTLHGTLVIRKDGSISIEQTKNGEGALELAEDPANKFSFQQVLLVHEGVVQIRPDDKEWQRRAVAQYADGHWAIIESTDDLMLNDFSRDLVELGIVQAIYLDMGAWDEGWYKLNARSKAIVIGKNKSQTGRQTNWLLINTQ